jgi:flagellar basal-body rod protein FlgC
MTLNNALKISSSGLTAERFRMDVISANIANANSVKTNGQDPYRRRMVVLYGDENGVKLGPVMKDMSELRAVQDPSNPLADDKGYVYYSNIEPVHEMVDMIGASRAYEANIAAFNSVKSMIKSALNIGKV